MYTSRDRADSLRESIQYPFHLLADERSAITQDFAEISRVPSSFAPPSMSLHMSALLITGKVDLFPHSWQPTVSLVLF